MAIGESRIWEGLDSEGCFKGRVTEMLENAKRKCNYKNFEKFFTNGKIWVIRKQDLSDMNPDEFGRELKALNPPPLHWCS